jgi:hypothetical protein
MIIIDKKIQISNSSRKRRITVLALQTAAI